MLVNSVASRKQLSFQAGLEDLGPIYNLFYRIICLFVVGQVKTIGS